MPLPPYIAALRLAFALFAQVQRLLTSGLFTAIDGDLLTGIKCAGGVFVKVRGIEAARSGIVAASQLEVLRFRVDRPRRQRVPNLPGG